MKKKYIGEGTNGICYELANGKILKIFKGSKSLDRLEDYKYFKNYLNGSIIFPEEFLVQGNKFIGYITKKVDGETFDKSLMINEIKKIYEHVIELEKNIEFISNGKIKMADVHSSNVLYDGISISILDPDLYRISTLDSEELFYRNIREIKKLIYDLLYFKIRETSISKKDILYSELRKYIVNDYEINYMILECKRILEEYYQKEILKFEDIGDTNGNMYCRTYRSR